MGIRITNTEILISLAQWPWLVLLSGVCSIAAKDVACLSPAESVTNYDHSNRKQKYHWKSRTNRQVALAEQTADNNVSGSQGSVAGSWSVSGTSQWQYPTDVIVSSASDLLHIQQFLVGKVCFIYRLWCCWFGDVKAVGP